MNGGLAKYLGLVKQWWWLLVVSALIPMVVSYYFASQRADFYQAKVLVMVGPSFFEEAEPDPNVLRLRNTLAYAYAELVKQEPIVQAVVERLGLQTTPAALVTQINTWVHSDAHLLEIQVTDSNPEAASLIANALADELIRRSPGADGVDLKRQAFIEAQLEDLQLKIEDVTQQIDELNAQLPSLTSAAELQEAQDRIDALENVKLHYQSNFADLYDIYQSESTNVLSLFDPAEPPMRPIAKNTKVFVAVAGAAGMGLALGAVFLMDYLDPTFRWENGGTQSLLGVPVLGAIPQVARKNIPLSKDEQLLPVAEGVRSILVNVFLMQPGRPLKTLLFSSPGTAEGKSFVLANLAIALASGGNRVIAVDADLRRPSLHELFDQPNIVGLADVLGDRVEGEGRLPPIPLQETRFDKLRFLPAGRLKEDPVALLTSSRFPILLDFLIEQSDIVLIDSPPVLGPSDAKILTTMAEGTILVVSVGRTNRQLIRQAKDQLVERSSGSLLGFVVNRVKPKEGYYYYADARHAEWLPQSRDQDTPSMWLTVEQAADRLGVSKAMIRQWCKSGRLPAEREWLWWRINRRHLKQVIEESVDIPVSTPDAEAMAERLWHRSEHRDLESEKSAAI